MLCKYCGEKFNSDDRVVLFQGCLFHEVECLTDYVIERLTSEPKIYIEYLVDLVMEGDVYENE